MAATDKSLLAEPTGSSHLKKLVIDAPSESDGPKVVDVDAPPPPPEDDLEVEEVEPSLADLMMGDALQNKAERAAKTAKEEKRMKKSFGDGMKKGLKKGFFDRKPSSNKPVAKPKPKPKEEEMPTITRSSKKEPGEVMQSMKEEIASSMAQDRHPLAAALQGGEWVTPDLIKEMAKRPVLAKGMSNPKYQARFAASVYIYWCSVAAMALRESDSRAVIGVCCIASMAWSDIRHAQAALQELQKDPKNGAKKFDSDPELKRFLTEFCEVMGSHMIKLAGDEDAPKPSTPALPTEKEKKEMGPLCSQIAEDCANGKGPEPCKTKKEQDEVDAVLKNEELRELLMNPKTQELMQRCSDPRAFQEAMRDPANRAIIGKLEQAGLVQLQR